MPLTMANSGRKLTVLNVQGPADMRMQLINMGFIPGASLRVISKNPSAVLVSLRNARIMLHSGFARQIQVR